MLSIVLLALLVFAATASASPTSFARWATQWKAASDQAINAALDPCQKHFLDNAPKAGACAVRNVRLVFTRVAPIWDRAVERVAQGQTPACREAIHVYWLATRRQQAADLSYLRSHGHVTVTQLNLDLSAKPFATMGRVAASAKLRAVRICG
jgi:broad specificity polyphosphatase/5'/3'-nucleotidase SurE